MPIPFIIGAGALAASGFGLTKGAKGVSDLSNASGIIERSQRALDLKRKELVSLNIDANDELRNLGQLKVDIFNNQIKHVIDTIKKVKNAGANIKNFDETITAEEVREIQKKVTASLNLESGLLSGAAAGALTGVGAYGSVGLLASASTGTAISTLSGAAAKSATLAWLGGGSLASGGFGMAGGTMVLGGIVTGPALAITGLHLAGKGEKALTQARECEARSAVNISAIEVMEIEVKSIITNALEVQMALLRGVQRFEKIKVYDDSDSQAFKTMLVMGKGLKNILDQPILDPNKQPIKNIRYKCEGYLEI
ncbi:hypothetical protein H4W00_001432 [Psychrobacter sp. PL19]|uniref:hypothetical protein n=1 Tax=Psychrobacter sp. PL19 TaxID=2760711 RepID=UPI001AEB77E6